MTTTSATRPVAERARDVFRRVGNPFRNHFARNPDDEVCAHYHVPELFALEREQLLGVVDLYRYSPTTHSEVVPVLGNKGSGKTHLLFSIKHGTEGSWQLLVTPGTYQRDTEFLEYLLFQVIDTLLGGAKQKNTRPLDFIGEQLVRHLLRNALGSLSASDRLELFPLTGFGRWGRKLGLGNSQAQERTQWLIDSLNRPCPIPFHGGATRKAIEEVGLEANRAFELVKKFIERTENHNTAGLMRRHILEGFTRAVLLGDEAELATFLTYGFAELEFQVRPTRQDLVLALFKAVMGVLQGLRIPVVVAFDQLEDLLLARRNDDSHRTAEAFFAGIVQAMHQLDGLCFLIFAERGLWNRFVPSLDGYIQDRLNNPVHLPEHGTLQALRLEAPGVDLVYRVVEARLRPSLAQVTDQEDLPTIFPFSKEDIERVAKTEPTLRDMLQQFRNLFDNKVFGKTETTSVTTSPPESNRLPGTPVVKSVVVVESPATPGAGNPEKGRMEGTSAKESSGIPRASLTDLWDQEIRAARRKIEPEGSLTGATREIQSGLGAFLQICHEHGVKVGPWRMSHVVPEWTFGDHPTYGVISIAHWVCRDGQPWKVGVGQFLGRGPAKPRDLGTKLSVLEADPPVVDHLILFRPEDDLALSGRSKSLWLEAEKKGCHARMEPVSIEVYATLYAFPRILAALRESMPAGQPIPNLADLIQDRCEKLLVQTCMPIQG